MLTDVRQRVTREHYGRRGRAIDPAWASRWRLVTGFENLSPEAFTRMWNGLIDTGAPGIESLHAYTVKEDLRALLAMAGTNPSRPPARAVLPPGGVLPGARGPPPRGDDRGVVARHRGRDHDRLLQRPIRGLQPASQARRTQCLRVPQRRQPTPTHTLGLHPPTPAGLSQEHPDARSSLKSRVCTAPESSRMRAYISRGLRRCSRE